MSTDLEGCDSSTLAPAQVQRCPGQDAPAVKVRAQLERTRERLTQKGIARLFALEVYAFNCDRHEGAAHHVDLVTWAPDVMRPQDVVHTIAALEAALKVMKSGAT